MLILVSGGSGSGKSEFAEGLVVSAGLKERVYLATMQVWDQESVRRVERHRAMRAGKGFATLECPTGLERLEVPAGSAVLLEDLSNLSANEYFSDDRECWWWSPTSSTPTGCGTTRRPPPIWNCWPG